MGETLQAALIALVGVALGGLLTGWFQRENTKALMNSEMMKLRLQLDGEARIRLLGRKQDLLMDSLAELVAATDAELHSDFDYVKIVTLIHRVQLLLNTKQAAEAALNDATTQLGFAVQAAISGNRDVTALLGAQSHVIEAGRSVLNQTP